MGNPENLEKIKKFELFLDSNQSDQLDSLRHLEVNGQYRYILRLIENLSQKSRISFESISICIEKHKPEPGEKVITRNPFDNKPEILEGTDDEIIWKNFIIKNCTRLKNLTFLDWI